MFLGLCRAHGAIVVEGPAQRVGVEFSTGQLRFHSFELAALLTAIILLIQSGSTLISEEFVFERLAKQDSNKNVEAET